MILKRVSLEGSSFTSAVNFPVRDAQITDPFIVKSIDGLGPPEIDVNLVNSLYQGGTYQGRRPRNREVVMLIGLNPNYALGQTVDTLRETLYKFLTTGSSASQPGLLKFRLWHDVAGGATIWAEVEGVISRMETAIFSKEPAIQITILCKSPFFTANAAVTIAAAASIDANNYKVINYMGTAETGIRATFTINQAMTPGIFGSLSFFQNETSDALTFDGTFAAGDIVTIDTQLGSRSLTRTTVANPYYNENLTGTLLGGSIWPMFKPGENKFLASGPFGTNGTVTWGEVRYTPKYWGI